MGWYYTKGASKKDIINELTKPYQDEKCGLVKTVAQKTGKDGLWYVREIENPLETCPKRIICLALLQSERGYGWGYKPMDESMGPYYYDCPIEFLDIAPETNSEWRDNVRKYWSSSGFCKALSPGQYVYVKDCKILGGTFVRSSRHSIILSNAGRLYRVPAEYVIC